MNKLAPMKNCHGGMQGNLNRMPGFMVEVVSLTQFPVYV